MADEREEEETSEESTEPDLNTSFPPLDDYGGGDSPKQSTDAQTTTKDGELLSDSEIDEYGLRRRYRKLRRKKKKNKKKEWSAVPYEFIPCPHLHFKADTVERAALTRNEHTALLATPKGYRWEPDKELRYIKKVKGIGRKRKVKNKLKRAEKQTEKEDKDYIGHFLGEVWKSLPSEMLDQLRQLLVEEFGMSEEEADDFIEEQKVNANTEKKEVKKRKKPFCVPNTKVGVRHKWIKDFSRIFACKVTDYVVMMLSCRRTMRVRKLAEVILNHFCDITGEKTSLNTPKTQVHRIMVFVADRLAVWLDSFMKETTEDKKTKDESIEARLSVPSAETGKEPKKRRKEEKEEEEEEEEEEERKEKEKSKTPSSKGSSKPPSKPTSKEPSTAASKSSSKEASKASSKAASKASSKASSKETSKPSSKAASKASSKASSKESSKPASKASLKQRIDDEGGAEQAPTDEKGDAEEVKKEEDVKPAEEEPEVVEAAEEEVNEEEEEEKEKEEEEVKVGEEEEEEGMEEEEEEALMTAEEEIEKESSHEIIIPEVEEYEPGKEYMPPVVPIRADSSLVYQITKGDGSYFNVRQVSTGSIAERIAEARMREKPTRAKHKEEIHLTDSPLTLATMKEWANWASKATEIAVDWSVWIDNTVKAAQQKVRRKKGLKLGEDDQPIKLTKEEWRRWQAERKLEDEDIVKRKRQLKIDADQWRNKMDRAAKSMEPEKEINVIYQSPLENEPLKTIEEGNEEGGDETDGEEEVAVEGEEEEASPPLEE